MFIRDLEINCGVVEMVNCNSFRLFGHMKRMREKK